MFILSATTPYAFPSTTPRVSFVSISTSSSKFLAVPLTHGLRKPLSCPCLVYSLKLRAMAKLVKDKESSPASESGVSHLASCSAAERKELSHSRRFLNARSEDELLSGIREEAEAGRLPSAVASGMEELYKNYKNAIFQSGNPKADEIVFSNMTAVLDRIFLDVEEPFDFPPYHKAMREPFDYFTFGQNYIRPLVDFRNSYVGNISIFSEMEEKLKEGHNIVLISNHQTEADPAVIALLLETTNSHVAENLTYVAGDRVVTDPLCKPFSMGRNLICVYSKKHIFDVPELADMKRKANTRSLKEMAMLLRNGSQIIWIAPSGGRDRPDPVTEEWHPAPFDAAAVDNFRRLVKNSRAPGHIYPLALLCHNIMPPPRQVLKQIGEKRMVSFHGVGLSVAPEVDFSEISASCETPDVATDIYNQALYNSVSEQYNVLKSAVESKKGLGASTQAVSLSQPWS